MFAFHHTLLENKRLSFSELNGFLNQHHFEIGGNWDYSHGYFDRKLEENPGYLFLRIPVQVEEGSFGEDGAQLRIGTPFLLRHKYQRGLDDYVFVTNRTAAFNQFSEPVDPDASLKQEDIDKAAPLIKDLEQAFQTYFNYT
jgi:hypothetical protein